MVRVEDDEQRLTVDELPFDPRPPGERDELEVIFHRSRVSGGRRQAGDVGRVVAVATRILYEAEPGRPVSEWLSGHMADLDAVTTTYRRCVRHDRGMMVVFEPVVEFLGAEMDAQVVVLFRQALRGTDRDPLMVLSDPSGEYSGKVLRRGEVVVVLVLGETDALKIAPGAASALGVERISHELFRKIASEGVNHMVVLARRRVARVNMPSYQEEA